MWISCDCELLCKENISVYSNGHNRVLENQDLSYLVIDHFLRPDIINENRGHFVYVTMCILECGHFGCMALYGFQPFL